jgi:hypothetical protein
MEKKSMSDALTLFLSGDAEQLLAWPEMSLRNMREQNRLRAEPSNSAAFPQSWHKIGCQCYWCFGAYV